MQQDRHLPEAEVMPAAAHFFQGHPVPKAQRSVGVISTGMQTPYILPAGYSWHIRNERQVSLYEAADMAEESADRLCLATDRRVRLLARNPGIDIEMHPAGRTADETLQEESCR